MGTMTKLSLKWKQIFDEISTADEHVVGKINYYNLASILEDLYVENAELKERVEALEKDKNQWYHPESSVAINKTYTDGLL
jgi:transposase